MSRLSTYKKKRKPDETPEPMDDAHSLNETLKFVVQKHQASHLHYDLRLELDGVLISWAVPKGPPVFDDEKRIAIMVEDHPYSYKDFEGAIPKGNYGAGKVVIWDEGNYSTLNALTLAEAQKEMRAGLKKGHVAVVLNGKRMQGVYHLVRTSHDGQKNAWLLFKKSKINAKPDKKPAQVSLMLAHTAEKAFSKKDWIFEVKWDGYRTLARIDKGKVRLISRNQKSFNLRFSTIAESLKALSQHEVILDGEVVVLDSMGRSNFQLLQNYLRKKEGELVFYVFDLLYCDGHDLRERPLIERKERLEVLLSPLKDSRIRYSDHIEENGVSFFKEAKKLELEGIIAKNAQSTYQEARSRDWQKIRASLRQEFVIGGFTAPQNSRAHFGSLMVGFYEGKKFIFAGLVGTGFSDATLKELRSKLESAIRKSSPFDTYPKMAKDVTYVNPILVCEVSFTEWTRDAVMRHPVYLGLRVDKEAKDVKADPSR